MVQVSSSTSPVPHPPAQWNIGPLKLRSRVLPAPMCNITDRPFREILRSMGADLVYTQMVSAEGLIRGDKGTWSLLDIQGEQPPVAVQLLGSEPERVALAAKIVQDQGAALVDLNMGCPARKVTGNACGSALMRDPQRVAAIVRAMRHAVSIPVTVKMRAGWDDGQILALDIARICEAEGADAVALHARTRQQGYRGQADWRLIAALKQTVKIPVTGNGDVTSPADAVRMIRETGCDAVMIGRGLIGNPWLLRACERAMLDFCLGLISSEDDVPSDEMVECEEGSTRALIRVPRYLLDVNLDQRFQLVLQHTRMMVQTKGERRGILEMRKHTVQYLRGLHGARTFRERLMHIETLTDLEKALQEYREWLQKRLQAGAAINHSEQQRFSEVSTEEK
ncbi:MAG: tRNA dihydrouridine synthase DusB [Candidatus Sumerlaeaceae bacterium]|nr:tRNA dihydrouridine synthase DusB [Candidatus Sumerlaeaceae bacterium]